MPAAGEDVPRSDRGRIEALVDGIARSGGGLDRTMNDLLQAAQLGSRDDYPQDPRLLEFVRSKPRTGSSTPT